MATRRRASPTSFIIHGIAHNDRFRTCKIISREASVKRIPVSFTSSNVRYAAGNSCREKNRKLHLGRDYLGLYLILTVRVSCANFPIFSGAVSSTTLLRAIVVRRARARCQFPPTKLTAVVRTGNGRDHRDQRIRGVVIGWLAIAAAVAGGSERPSS